MATCHNFKYYSTKLSGGAVFKNFDRGRTKAQSRR